MPRAIITLTTDFGEGSSYVAQMKGVILSLNPDATVVDITHSIPAQDVRRGALVIDEVVGRFPPGSIHVAVIDPGVGTDRQIIFAEIDGRSFVAPDNGLLSLLARRHEPARMLALTNQHYWLKTVSATFHGRDIMAPVAASVSLGVNPAKLGTPLEELSKLTWPDVEISEKKITGTVVSFDSFGNLITDITEAMLESTGPRSALQVQCGPHSVYGLARTYAQRPVDSLVALLGSSRFLELAIVNGNAVKKLGIEVGAEVVVKW